MKLLLIISLILFVSCDISKNTIETMHTSNWSKIDLYSRKSIYYAHKADSLKHCIDSTDPFVQLDRCTYLLRACANIDKANQWLDVDIKTMEEKYHLIHIDLQRPKTLTELQ